MLVGIFLHLSFFLPFLIARLSQIVELLTDIKYKETING